MKNGLSQVQHYIHSTQLMPGYSELPNNWACSLNINSSNSVSTFVRIQARQFFFAVCSNLYKFCIVHHSKSRGICYSHFGNGVCKRGFCIAECVIPHHDFKIKTMRFTRDRSGKNSLHETNHFGKKRVKYQTRIQTHEQWVRRR